MNKPRYPNNDIHDVFIGIHEEWDMYLDTNSNCLSFYGNPDTMNHDKEGYIVSSSKGGYEWEDEQIIKDLPDSTIHHAIKKARAIAFLKRS